MLFNFNNEHLCFPLFFLLYCFSGQIYLAKDPSFLFCFCFSGQSYPAPDTTLTCYFKTLWYSCPSSTTSFNILYAGLFKQLSFLTFCPWCQWWYQFVSYQPPTCIWLLCGKICQSSPFAFISFWIASCASQVETKLKKFPIGFSSGDLGGILNSVAPIFSHFHLPNAAFCLGHPSIKNSLSLELALAENVLLNSSLTMSKLCTHYWTFILSVHDYTFSMYNSNHEVCIPTSLFLSLCNTSNIKTFCCFLHSLLFGARAWSKGLVLNSNPLPSK